MQMQAEIDELRAQLDTDAATFKRAREILSDQLQHALNDAAEANDRVRAERQNGAELRQHACTEADELRRALEASKAIAEERTQSMDELKVQLAGSLDRLREAKAELHATEARRCAERKEAADLLAEIARLREESMRLLDDVAVPGGWEAAKAQMVRRAEKAEGEAAQAMADLQAEVEAGLERRRGARDEMERMREDAATQLAEAATAHAGQIGELRTQLSQATHIGHDCIGHKYIGHKYMGHNFRP